jgi:hypothetical protein
MDILPIHRTVSKRVSLLHQDIERNLNFIFSNYNYLLTRVHTSKKHSLLHMTVLKLFNPSSILFRTIFITCQTLAILNNHVQVSCNIESIIFINVDLSSFYS